MFVRLITGQLAAREIKLPYTCSVLKCPIRTDKSKIEFVSLPETEYSEVVIQLSNDSTKNYMVELVPPNLRITGLLVNPLVTELKAGKSALVCIRYNSDFRDLTYQRMQELFNKENFGDNKPGIGIRNKKLDQRLKKEKEEADSKTTAVDPKAAKGGKPGAPVAAPKKEEAKKVDPKAPKKTP